MPIVRACVAGCNDARFSVAVPLRVTPLRSTAAIFPAARSDRIRLTDVRRHDLTHATIFRALAPAALAAALR
jgi:hypothetical protein